MNFKGGIDWGTHYIQYSTKDNIKQDVDNALKDIKAKYSNRYEHEVLELSILYIPDSIYCQIIIAYSKVLKECNTNNKLTNTQINTIIDKD